MIKKYLRYSLKFFSYPLSATIVRNNGYSVVGIILKLIPAMQGKLSSGLASTTQVAVAQIVKVLRSQGIPGFCKYLKSCSVALQQSICGYYVPDISPRVSRTNKGIPRVLPVRVRNLIRSGQTFYMKFGLTLFSIYRDMVYDSPVKTKTITAPFSGSMDVIHKVKGYIPLFVKLFAPTASRELLIERFSFVPINKSSPMAYRGLSSTNPITLIRSAFALDDKMIETLYTLGRMSGSRSNILISMMRSAGENISYVMPEWLKLIFQIRSSDWKGITDLSPPGSPIGKLGLKQEAAGKMRVFAMVDPWTQLVLRPFHLALFRILSKVKMDGTFDQLRPLKRAWEFSSLYSMDLSSATDRLPMMIQIPLIQQVFKMSTTESEAWRYALVGRPYLVPKTNEFIFYSVGQPMGALSSWAMLAFTHHLIVQCAAWECGHPHTKLFKDYAVLGDDIVIFNRKVAKSYQKLISGLGVECNLAKSILSHKGIGLEFAKKTFYQGVNVSVTPIRELYAALRGGPVSILQYGKIYGLNMPKVLTICGFGYRVRGSANNPFWKVKNKKVKCLLMTDLLMRNDESVTDIFSHAFSSVPSLNLLISSFSRFFYEVIVTGVRKSESNLVKISALLSRLDPERGSDSDKLYFKLYRTIYVPYATRLQDLYSRCYGKYVEINGAYRPRRDLVGSITDAALLFKKVIDIEKDMSSLSIDNMKALRSKETLQVSSTPKAERYVEAWKVIFKTFVIPTIKLGDDLVEKNLHLKESSEQAMESSFFFVSGLRRLFLTSRTTQQILSARSNTVKGKAFFHRPVLFADSFGWRSVIWTWLFESVFSATVTTLTAYLGWVIYIILTALWTDSYDKVSALLLLPLDPLIASLEAIWKWLFLLFNPNSSYSLLFKSLLTVAVVYSTTVVNTLYWYSGELLEVYRLIEPGGDWFTIMGFIPGVLYKFGITPAIDLVLAPYHFWIGTAESFVSNPWLYAWGETFKTVTAVILSDLHYLISGVRADNILCYEIFDEHDGSVESPTMDSNPWDRDSDSSGSSTPRQFDHYFRPTSPVSLTSLDTDSDPASEGWILVEPHPDSIRCRLITLAYSHCYLVGSSSLTLGLLAARWLLSTSSSIIC